MAAPRRVSLRKRLLDRLAAIAASHDVDPQHVRLTKVEEKSAALTRLFGEFTADRLGDPALAAEFSPSELRSVHAFLDSVRAAAAAPEDWPKLRAHAVSLTLKLRARLSWLPPRTRVPLPQDPAALDVQDSLPPIRVQQSGVRTAGPRTPTRPGSKPGPHQGVVPAPTPRSAPARRRARASGR